MRTSRPGLALLAVASCAAALAAAEPARTYRPIADPTRVIPLRGCVVRPPAGVGWLVTREGEASVGFARPAGGGTRTLLASVTTIRLDPGSLTPDSLRALAGGIAEAGGEGDRPLEPVALAIVPDTSGGAPGLRVRCVVEDRDVPRHRGETFVLSVWQRYVVHPQAPGLLIRVDYTERTGPRDAPADSVAAAAFLDGVRLVLRDTTAGRELKLGGELSSLRVAHGSVWVQRYRRPAEEGPAARDADEVLRIDPATGAVLARIPVPKETWGLATTSDAVWVVCHAKSRPGIVRIDAATNRVTATLRFGGRPIWAAADGDGVWVTDLEGHAVWGIDARSPDAEPRRVAGLRSPCGVTCSGGLVWVTDTERRVLVSIDPRSALERGAPIGVGGEPYFVAAGAGSIWVLSLDMRALQRVDPATRTVTATIPLPGSAAGPVAFAGGRVWVGGRCDGTLTCVDPATNRVVGPPLRAGVLLDEVTGADSTLWATDPLRQSLVAIPR